MRSLIFAGVLSLAALAIGLAPPMPPRPANAETDQLPRCPVTMPEVMAEAEADTCMTTREKNYMFATTQMKCDDLEKTVQCALDSLKGRNSSLMCDYVGVTHVLDTCMSPDNFLQRHFHITPLDCLIWRDSQAHNPCAMVRCDEGMSCVVLPVMIPGMEDQTDLAVCKNLDVCRTVEELGCSEQCHKHVRNPDSGCETCECRCPPHECPRHCIEGFKEGTDGCLTCECKDAMLTPDCPVGEPMCEVKCDHYAIDYMGCSTCKCQCEPLCCDEACPTGSVNAWDDSGCRTCECVSEGSTGDLGQVCPDPECPQDCGVEYYTGADGCEMCRCDGSTACDDTDMTMCDAPCWKEPLMETCECVCPGAGVAPGPDTMCQDAQCPQDCGAEYYWSEEQACSLCRCDGLDACHGTDDFMCDAPCRKVAGMTTCDCVCPEETSPPSPPSTSEPCITATCLTGCRSVPLGNGCYGCECTQTTPYTPTTTSPCPQVTCQTGCRYVNDQYGCIMCDCETTTPTTPACTMVTCGPGCREVAGENGCPICDCPTDPEEPCRGYECPEGCRPQQDAFFCKCECPTTTPHPCQMEDMACPMDCETEVYTDPETGCEMCRCAAPMQRCPPLEDCPRHCEKYETDEAGCIMCECDADLTFPETCPLYKCSQNCDYGRVIDQDGCRTCECKPHPCDTVTCPGEMECNMCYNQHYCERTMGVNAPCGRCFDTYMPTPTPAYPTCENTECYEGQECVMEEVMCVMAPCPPLPTCVERTTPKPSCPEIMCMIWCEFGNVLDDRGCNMCKCKPDPCLGARCPGGKQCTLAEAPICAPGQTCPRVPMCVSDEGACQQPREVGNCRAMIPKYYYNSETHQCEQFFYGGCQGNDNNFETMEDCMDMCGVVDPQVATTTTPEPQTTSGGEGCPDVMCMMWCEFGNEQDDNGCDMCKCKPNPCEAMRCPAGQKCDLSEAEECPEGRTCPHVPTCVADGPICQQPQVVGRCRASMKRYYYNMEAGECQMFFYGGCQGNDNNFESREVCQQLCAGDFGAGTTTAEPQTTTEEGCLEVMCMMWCEFGNEQDDKGCDMCKCKPNPCETMRCPEGQKCEVSETVGTCVADGPVCEQPKVVGPCKARNPRWYFDQRHGCQMFFYGGCQGNDNNFEAEEVCLHVCGPPPTTEPTSTARPLLGACEDDQKRCSYGACYDANKHCDGQKDCFDGSDEEECEPTPPDCGPVCMMFCEHGMVKDERGCATCKCNPNPCQVKGLRCSEEEKCEDEMCVSVVDPNHNVCKDPPESGRCRAYFPSWYYDPAKVTCLEFVYGGCGGNGNRFKTKEDCMAKCPRDESGEVTVRPQVDDLVCPAVPDGMMGICMEGCGPDNTCPEGQLCCSNGCGHACMPGVPAPPPTTVPRPENPCQQGEALPGVFCGRGPSRQDCPNTHYCDVAPDDRYAVCCPMVTATAQTPETTTKPVCRDCSYDACEGTTCPFHPAAVCKHTCNCEYVFVDPGTNKVVDCSAPQPLCERRQAEAKAAGERAPQCTADGQFSWDQCEEGWCWCVDDMGIERSGTRMELKNTFEIQLICDPFKTTEVEFMLRFDADYDALLPNEAAKMKFEAALERKLMSDYGVEEGQINDVSVSPGSIVTEFTLVEGGFGDLASRASYIESQAMNGKFELEYEGRTLKPETTETEYEGMVIKKDGGNNIVDPVNNGPQPAASSDESSSGLSMSIVMVIAIAAFVVVALVVGLVVLVMSRRRQYSGQANFTVPVDNPGYVKHSPPPTYSSVTAIKLSEENEVKADLPSDYDVVGELPEMRETAPPGDQTKRYSVDC